MAGRLASTGFVKGDLIVHPEHGSGVVVRVREPYLEVAFDNGSRVEFIATLPGLIRAPNQPRTRRDPGDASSTNGNPADVIRMGFVEPFLPTPVVLPATAPHRLSTAFWVVRRAGGFQVRTQRASYDQLLDLTLQSDGTFIAIALESPSEVRSKGYAKVARRSQQRLDKALTAFEASGDLDRMLDAIRTIADQFAGIDGPKRRAKRKGPWISVVQGGLPSLGKRR